MRFRIAIGGSADESDIHSFIFLLLVDTLLLCAIRHTRVNKDSTRGWWSGCCLIFRWERRLQKNGFCLTLRLISDNLNGFISTHGEEVVEGGEEVKITFSECH